MATSTTRDRQTRLTETHGVHEYDLGDLTRKGPSGKVHLSECPLCASDPSRPRHYFAPQSQRPVHFEREHGPEAIPSRRR